MLWNTTPVASQPPLLEEEGKNNGASRIPWLMYGKDLNR